MKWEESPLFEVTLGRLKAFKRFFSTRRAVLEGLPLGANETEQLDVMGPWQFSFAETLAAGFPGAILIAVVNFIWPEELNPDIDAHVLQERLKQVESYLSPFLLALSFTLTAYLSAWCSLKKIDRTGTKFRRALREFLYLEGTYGFAFQTFGGVMVALWSLDESRGIFEHAYSFLASKFETDIAFLILMTFFYVIIFGNFGWYIVMIKKIGKRLFQFNGYSALGNMNNPPALAFLLWPTTIVAFVTILISVSVNYPIIALSPVLKY